MSVPSSTVVQYYTAVLRVQPTAAQIAQYQNVADAATLLTILETQALTMVNPITRLYQGAFGRVPDSDGLSAWTALYKNGPTGTGTISLQEMAGTDFVKSPEFINRYGTNPLATPQSTTAYISQLYVNVLNRAPETGEVQLWEAAVARLRGQGQTDHQITTELLLSFTQSPEFTNTSLPYIQTFQAECAAGTETYTGSLWDQGATGKTYALTSGVDNITGTPYNDVFDGSLNAQGVQTLQGFDSLNGNGGVDTLYADLNVTGTLAPTLTAIDNINVEFSAAATLSLANATGYQQLVSEGSTANATFSNIATTDVTLGVVNSAAGTDSTFTFTNAATQGANEVDLNVSNVAGPSVITINGIETINLNSSDAASNFVFTANAMTTLNIDGDAGVDLDQATLLTQASKLTTVNAALLEGDLAVNPGALGDSATTVVVLGGSGNDTIDVDEVANVVSVDGGAGNDTIIVDGNNINNFDHIDGGLGVNTLSTNAALAVGTTDGISNIDALTFTAAANQDLDAVAGITQVNVSVNNNALDVNLTDAAADFDTLNITSTARTVSVARKADATDNELAVTLGSAVGKNGATVTTLTLNNEETLSIASVGGANTVTNFNAADLTSLTITGAQTLNLANAVGAVNLATIDASASTGAVTVSGADSLADMTVTAGSGSLDATTGVGNDTITGSVRADVLVAGDGDNRVEGLGGNDDITVGDNDDIVLGGEGNDTITTGAGDDSIDGGANDDRIDVAGNYTTADTIDGGAGTNTLAIDVAANVTPEVTNIQTVEVEFGGAATLNLSKSTSTTLVVNTAAGAGSAGGVSAMATGSTFRNLNTADTLTLDTVADAALTVDARAVNKNGLTITDAEAVTVTNGAGANGSFNNLVLDNIDTTGLTVTGGSAGGTLGTGNITGTDQLATLSVTSTNGAVTLGSVTDGDSLTSLTVTASVGDVQVGEVGAGGSAANLETVTAAATGGADIDLGVITANGVDNVMTVTLSSGTGSNVDVESILNNGGTINATLSGNGAVDFLAGAGQLSADEITLTRSGSGSTEIDDITTVVGDAEIVRTGSGALTLNNVNIAGDLLIDASASSGVLKVDAIVAGDNVTVLGGSAADFVDAGGATLTASLVGGTGNDTLIGGASDDTILGGDGEDSITAGTGVDSLLGGADNDTFVLGANLTNEDFVDGGTGTNTATLTTAAVLTTPNLDNIQTVQVTFGGNHTLSLADSAETNLVINTLTGGAARTVAVTNIANGSTFRNLDVNDLITLDTVANASLTVDQQEVDAGMTLTITDADAVTFVNGSAAADTDITTVTLDNVDTTSLTVTGASIAGNTLAIGTAALNSTNALETITVTTSTTGATAELGAVADADGLTSLTVNAVNANATVGAIGAGGSAEALATITATASGGATATIGDITADTTAAAPINVVTVSANAATASTVTLGDINNSQGDIVFTAEGAGVVDADILTATDLIFTRTGNGTTDLENIDASGIAELTLSGSGLFQLRDVNVDGDLIIDASLKTGILDMDQNNSTGDASITGGAGADTIFGSDGDDTLVGNNGNDLITAGAGADSILGGAGDDDIVFGTFLAAGDVVDGGTGANTLSATINAARTATISNVQTLDFDMTNGSFNAANTTGATTINLTSTGAGNAFFTNLANTVTTINQIDDAAAVSFGYRAGAAATVTLDFADAGEAITNVSTTFSNVADLTVSGDAAKAVDLGSLVGGAALTSLSVLGSDAALDTGNLTAVNLETLSVSSDGTGLVTVGTLVDADALTSITVTGNNTGDIGIDDIGTAVGGNAALLQTVTITADINGESKIDVADIDAAGADLTAFTVDLDGDYAASSVGDVTADSLTSLDITTTAAGTSFTVDNVAVTTLGDINVAAGAAVTLTSVGVAAGTVGNITVTGAGDFTTTVVGVQTIGNVDTSGATGKNTVTLDNATVIGTEMTGGAGVDIFTGTGGDDQISSGTGADSITGNDGADTIDLGADAAIDTVVYTTFATTDTVDNFIVANDENQLDLSLFNAEIQALVLAADMIVGTGDALGAGVGTITNVTAGNGDISAATTRVYAVTDATYANAAALDAALITGGTHALKVANAAIVGDGLTFIWEDTSGDLNVSIVTIDTITAGATDQIDALTVRTVATLTGVSVADVTQANFEWIA